MLLKEFVYSFDLNRRQLGEIIYILVNTKLENSLYYRYAKILNTKSVRKPKLSLMAISTSYSTSLQFCRLNSIAIGKILASYQRQSKNSWLLVC